MASVAVQRKKPRMRYCNRATSQHGQPLTHRSRNTVFLRLRFFKANICTDPFSKVPPLLYFLFFFILFPLKSPKQKSVRRVIFEVWNRRNGRFYANVSRSSIRFFLGATFQSPVFKTLLVVSGIMTGLSALPFYLYLLARSFATRGAF
jgi:hypothetical protein